MRIDHRREAERLLTIARFATGRRARAHRMELFAEAQVHALLAIHDRIPVTTTTPEEGR